MAAPSPATALPPLPEPLRLPRGSVHGLLALVLMGTFVYLLNRNPGAGAPQVLVNATVVVLAFYFGSHPTAGPTAAASGVAPPASRRPRVVRALLLLGFAGLAAWFVSEGTRLPDQLLQILEVLGGYVGGLVLSWVFHHRAHESPGRRRLAVTFRDLSAVGALGLTGFACYALATGLGGTFETDIEQALSLVVTYYFGSRVIAH